MFRLRQGIHMTWHSGPTGRTSPLACERAEPIPPKIVAILDQRHPLVDQEEAPTTDVSTLGTASVLAIALLSSGRDQKQEGAMPSHSSGHFINSADMTIISSVLHKAGFKGTEAVVDTDSKGDAERFLMRKFHGGARTEAELTIALEGRGTYSSGGALQTPKQMKTAAIDRWKDEGGA
jgi:hypothetical protein